MTAGVTIGQAAAFAGVTVKTVRHYHRLGLIGEPRRDASGYRRYGSADLLRLVQIRTLAAAGVPLAEVGAILDAGPDRFAAALADVERRLDERIDDLVARRDMLRRLVTGDRALLPAHVLEKLDRAAAEFGFTADDVTMAREGLVLIRALVPEGFDDYVSRVERALADPRYVALIKRLWQAAGWEPDDPRVDELAEALADHYLADPGLLPVPAALRERADGAIRYGLLSRHGEAGKPAWTRLNALVEARLRAAGVELPPGR
ncbi:transcriptional regulator, MerR family [[Actinomadura] parvosata subsp. kistnae]|uniref:MerR family transcriptional regulator n=1 Tax=[Actinomadura] parvosata subsp. kistnae TaxID=1909395 RepID=A0A1U9ZRU3_9ACTN|nr:MerR family transcriptional regulator [Nonomuraea sp. ATCC 55076]AQZ60653.1 MerR family transcriptional regulator [Nonomuraea sp. ATCC 55076]SPL90750.1 transcriptional regulator, MerR family [Actinomadura parvosata subsp. kistnae]